MYNAEMNMTRKRQTDKQTERQINIHTYAEANIDSHDSIDKIGIQNSLHDQCRCSSRHGL